MPKVQVRLAALWVAGLGISPYLVMAVIVVIYILLGCLMDSLSMILLTVSTEHPLRSRARVS